MDIVSAALSLYLLFPILNERQQRYSELIKKNLTSSPQEVEKRLELVKFLSLDESQYSSAEELVFVDGDGENEIESIQETENTVEVYLRDIHNHLKHFEFGEEIFSIGDREGLRSSVVSVNGDTVSRIRYDSEYRIIENIVWKNRGSVSESVILNKKNWFYADDNIYMTEEDFEANTFADTVFNEEKLPVKVSLYLVSETKDEKTEEKKQKKNLSKIEYFDYDIENRVTLDKEEFYEQKLNESTGRQKDVVTYTSEKRFEYREGFDEPDLKFYEDGKLRRHIQQLDEDSWYEYLYFPGGAEVKSKFVDGSKVEENLFLYGDR